MAAAVLSRRSFVKAGGALVVGAPMLRFPKAASAQAPNRFASGGPPDSGQADSYLTIHADTTAAVKTGRVEIGQGSTTGLLILVAEELDMDVGQLTFVRHDTGVTPNTGGTFGSSSIAIAGRMLRSAASAARRSLLGLASEHLGVPVGALTVSRGVVSGGGRSVSYGELVGGRLLSVALTGTGSRPARRRRRRCPVTDSSGSRACRGSTSRRRSRAPMSTSTASGCPGCCTAGSCGRSAKVPTETGRSPASSPSTSGRSPASATRGWCVAGDFLGVVASKEFDAIQAAARLRVTWRRPARRMSGSGNLFAQMRALDAAGQAPARTQTLER